MHGGHGHHCRQLQSPRQQKQEQIHQHTGLYVTVQHLCLIVKAGSDETDEPFLLPRRPQQSQALQQFGQRWEMWGLHQR